jgi:hypothetical protein
MKEFRISSHLLFIDFKSVYDRTDREQMYEAKNELNIPEKLIRLVKRNMISQIKIQLKISAPLITHKGVQQGDALACLLFIITTEYTIQKSGIQTRGIIFCKLVQLMAYVDDSVIIGRSSAAMKEAFQLLEEAS